jgi:hypothetical protein
MLAMTYFAVLLSGSNLPAQTFTADILGTVHDATGAVVSAAKVTLTRTNTGTTLDTISDGAGNYAFFQVQPAHYSLQVYKEGFMTFTVSDLEVLVSQRARIDVILKIGATSEKVDVSAGGTQMLETQSSEVGEVIQQKAILDMPLNGRNFIQLAELTPGVFDATVNNNSYSCATSVGAGGGAEGRSGAGTMAAMGMRESNVSYLIDGIEARSARWGNVTIKPAPDAIQEFKVETSDFEADSGRSSVITNITLKSGTNRLHGSAYEFIRNSELDGNDYFLNMAGTPRPEFQQNNFGASVGGPIKQGKLFFFGAYEGLRSRKGLAFNGLYPSAAQLAGNLADDSAGTGIFPTNSPLCQANPSSTKCVDVINPSTGQPFPGNVIPSSMLDPVAQKWLPYIRQPNVAVTPNQPSLPNFNFAFSPKEIVDDNQFHIRTDYDISQNNRLFGSYSYDARPHTLPQLPIDSDQSIPWRGQVLSTSWVHDFNSRTVNEFRFGYSRSRVGITGETSYGPNIAETVFGLQNINSVPITFAVPSPSIPGFGPIGSNWIAMDSTDHTFHFSDQVSMVRGSHTLKMGAEYHHQAFTLLCGCAPPGFSFTGQFSGNGLADFLLGDPFSGFAPYGLISTDARADYWGEYFQDNYRIRPSLTLNLGIRYETQQWPHDINGRQDAFIPAAGKVEAVWLGQIPNGIAPTPHKDFAPRVGFAYSPGFLKNTVIRGSYGIFYATDNWNELGAFDSAGPDLFVDRVPTSNPVAPTLSMEQSFASVTLGAANLPVGTGIFAADSTRVTPYYEEWTFGFQHTFGSNWLLDAAYVGNEGQHLFLRRDVNTPSLDPTGTIPIQARRPYSQYGFILEPFTGGWSDFNGLLAKVEHRTTTNGYLLGSFGWIKALDLGNCCNYQGIDRDFKALNKGPNDATVPLQLSVAYVYNLPVGRGKPFLSSLSRPADILIGGWSVSGITTFSRGLYTSPFVGFDYLDLGPFANNPLADLVGNPVPAKQSINQYWTPTAYALPGCSADPGVFNYNPCPTALHLQGDAKRNSLEGPGYQNWDIAAMKEIPLGERFTLQFRGEFFNAFNHPQFGMPNNTLNSGEFGVITSLHNPPREIQVAGKLIW